MAVEPTDEQIRKLHIMLEHHDLHPRFIARRAIDKSCYEVVEITDPYCVPAAGYPVAEQAETHSGAEALARVRSRSWTIDKMIKTLNGNDR